ITKSYNKSESIGIMNGGWFHVLLHCDLISKQVLYVIETIPLLQLSFGEVHDIHLPKYASCYPIVDRHSHPSL
ncbi:hypothetical protein PENTCL1PPCAC_3317, partial [Pristionchus entomophagus]